MYCSLDPEQVLITASGFNLFILLVLSDEETDLKVLSILSGTTSLSASEIRLMFVSRMPLFPLTHIVVS